MVPTIDVYAGKKVIASGHIQNGPSLMNLGLALFEPKVCEVVRTVTFDVAIAHESFRGSDARVQCTVEMAYRLDTNFDEPVWVLRGKCVGIFDGDRRVEPVLGAMNLVASNLVGRKIVVDAYSCQTRANGNFMFLAD